MLIAANAYGLKAKSYLIELEKYEASIADLRNKLQKEEQKPYTLKVPHDIQDLKYKLNKMRWHSMYGKQIQKIKHWKMKSS